MDHSPIHVIPRRRLLTVTGITRIAYLLLLQGLAIPSGVLLLVFITSTGIVLGAPADKPRSAGDANVCSVRRLYAELTVAFRPPHRHGPGGFMARTAVMTRGHQWPKTPRRLTRMSSSLGGKPPDSAG